MPPWMPLVGFGLYCANLLLGMGLQLRLYSLHKARWVHHVLYFLVFISALASLFSSNRWWALMPTLACLGLLPRFKGGTKQHLGLSFTGFFGYLLVIL
ncbi:MAG: hypothetical protein ACK41E_05205 [Deinococcales bacterium]